MLKKISYVVLLKSYDLKHHKNKNLVIQTITSVLKQSLPVCDLLIISHDSVGIATQSLIEQCILECEGSISRRSSVDANVLETHVFKKNNSKQFNDSKISLWLIKEDNTINTIEKLLSVVRTDWVLLLEPGMKVLSHANYELMRTIVEYPESIIIYGDHDNIKTNHTRYDPNFKPIFSLDFLYSHNYIGSFVLFKKNIIKKNQISILNKPFDILIFSLILSSIEIMAQVPAVSNRLIDLRKKIIHISVVLYSQYNNEITNNQILKKSKLTLKLIRNHLRRMYQGVSCREIKPLNYRLIWPIPKDPPLVSLIVPTKNGYSILKPCIESILYNTSYKNYEIIIVDNQSSELETLCYLRYITKKYKNIRIIKYSKKFNYSSINNLAERSARGTILGFINNDIEVINSNWLTEMVSHAVRTDVGCVGAIHYYPDGLVQHAGVIVGQHGVADNAFKNIDKKIYIDKYNYLCSVRNPDAVTGATMLVKRELFNQIGGFDAKNLKIAFNDVDICLKINFLGYRCVWTPFAELFHYESKTRKETNEFNATEVESLEHDYMKKRWHTDKWPKRDLLKRISFENER